jgi:hypothetical protein
MKLSRPTLALAVPFALLLTAACGSEPPGDVAAAPAAGTASPQAAAAGGEGGELPPGHPPIDFQAGGASLPSGHASSGSGGAAADGAAAASGGGLDWAVPAGWVSEPPANSMRRAQYRISGAGGDAECVVFYFGAGQGGDAQSNAERWASQFQNADGSPAMDTMKTRRASAGGREVLYVEARGTYDPGMMSGGAGGPKPGYALLGAVVQGPDANWFFKLTGPAAIVEAQRQAFEAMVGSVQPAT